MIYLDNAATTMQKPPEVAEAVCAAINGFGGVGRGAHEASLDAGVTVYQARARCAELFGAPSASSVAFASNITEALNIALCGLLGAGDHAITTAASHNSVLRPLYRLQEEAGVELSIAPIATDGTLSYERFEELFQENTKLIAVTHASNLTGQAYDIARLAAMAHAHGALCVVDAAQTAGSTPINMTTDGIDVLCFTGHKGLYGPQGTGGLCVAKGVHIRPLKVGGTGVHSYDKHHPTTMPDSLEAGTINAHGIAGLKAGVEFVLREGVEVIGEHTHGLAARLREAVATIDGITVYGDGSPSAIVCLNVRDYDSSEVADALSVDYGIATRAGAHCAPLMHEALGTSDRGAVRFSFGWFSTDADVDEAVRALREIAAEE
ncbi:aminotransferase class V-fold PLP-dependent enzyme [Adlercreutzia sp. ZJ141]|uniref:aminotransferase class V-fold PLP-dependent enzyme n=1 Tax=Adlercreutzia sp. ZJ141 TaxID=2709406 RepID=UPI0013EDB7A5|nr:aminotransferase class V-fold PLP-dependent enzyme [Adlercreutzia sp. ZJ141]